MKKITKKITRLFLAGLVNCATPQNSPNVNNLFIEGHKGETENYYVEAQQVYIRDVCIDRIIVLKGKNKPDTNPNHVDYVSARDNQCNDSVDDWQFKDPRYSMTRGLEKDILNAFYRIWPK